jgi:hypothetical protein
VELELALADEPDLDAAVPEPEEPAKVWVVGVGVLVTMLVTFPDTAMTTVWLP